MSFSSKYGDRVELRGFNLLHLLFCVSGSRWRSVWLSFFMAKFFAYFVMINFQFGKPLHVTFNKIIWLSSFLHKLQQFLHFF